MSDRSFGDYTNRNVVKNPLLSTAVIGLSIDDLTQNAVLLPAVPSQELIIRQDQQQHETQTRPLWHPEHAITNLSSGDANSNTTKYNLNPMDSKIQAQNDNENNNVNPTLSKAKAKSDDDFDVNEYFARLHGTRYVSAPINSSVIEQNADLQVEENLEEINLNEPDRSQDTETIQQSLTADIAQNFSQLPNVLPHVASAVFSSFSNMLSLKSREVTPDEQKTLHDVQHRPEAYPAALGVPETPVHVAPPPLREPPTSGTTSNYRITTKKKVYAQIPGLSSGDHQHTIQNQGPIGQMPPSYFVPDTSVPNVPYEDTKIENASRSHDINSYTAKSQDISANVYGFNKQATLDEPRDVCNLNQIASVSIDTTTEVQSDSQNKTIFFEMKQDQDNLSSHTIPNVAAPEFITSSVQQGPSTVIPPPPMFSNIPRRDSQTTIGKSILPPSVARRISANQPIIKSQTIPTMIPQDNIFIPTIPFLSNSEADFGSITPVQQSYTLFPSNNNQNIEQDLTNKCIQEQSSVQSHALSSINNPQSPLQEPLLTMNPLAESSILVPLASTSNNSVPPFGQKFISTEKSFTSSQKTTFTKNNTSLISNKDNNRSSHESGIFSSKDVVSISSHFGSTEGSSQISDTAQQLIFEQTNIAPPLFFNPSTLPQDDVLPKITKEMKANPEAATDSQKNSLIFTDTPSQTVKQIPVPPQFASNQNYRLTKKKLQYYSGPIEGVGNISNNVKPVLNPIEPNVFHGTLFTPDQNAQLSAPRVTTSYSLPVTHETLTPFDLSKTAPLFPALDTTKSEQQKPIIYEDYKTMFDVSNPTNEQYEEIQQETKSYGIIGSLKSKLSSIDINKIQNTVTTFFDPNYNDLKGAEKQENLSYDNLPVGNYQNFPPDEGTNLEVFVPTANYQQTYTTPYDYQIDYSQTMTQNPQNYQSQEYQAYHFPASNFTGWNSVSFQQPLTENSMFSTSTNLSLDTIQNNKNTAISLSQDSTVPTKTFASEKPQEIKEKSIDNVSKVIDEQSQNQSGVSTVASLDTAHNNVSAETSNVIDNKEQFKVSRSTVDSSLQSVFKTAITEESLKNIDPGRKPFIPTVDSYKSAFDQQINQPNLTLKPDDSIHKGESIQNFIGFPHSSDVCPNITSKYFCGSEPTRENFEIQFENKLNKENASQKIYGGPESLQENTDIPQTRYFDYQFINPTLNINEAKDNAIKKSFQSKQTDSGFDTLNQTSTSNIFPELKNLTDDLIPQRISDNIIGQNISALSSFSAPTVNDGKYEESGKFGQPAYSLFDFDHSDVSLIAAQTDYKDVEKRIENMTIIGNTENILKQGAVEVEDEPMKEISEHQISDLNICETCREVKKPEERDADDLTTQLIENIIAPIQLANPVEYPVDESNIPVVDRSEMSHITEDIIETMKLPPPIELIDDISVNISNINYGWSVDESHSSQVLLDHAYIIQPDPILTGFFQDKTLLFESIPTNASDEIKAEYRISQEDTSILSRPIIISAIPPDEDTKSDESGLDVHSIEQDARNDFPIYDEFVIEPSETDDDKIEYKERERSSDDPIPDVDTFTNRVERYKKLETNTDSTEGLLLELKKDPITFDLPTSTSPAITIASYFDTGNYAVDNHYRNSLTSPTALNAFTLNATASMRIPPGFEEEYKNRLNCMSQPALPLNIPYIPDTSTQTHTTISLTVNNPKIVFIPDTSTQTRGLIALSFSQCPIENLSVCDPEVKTMVDKIVEDHSTPTKIERLPAFSNIIESKKELVEGKQTDTKTERLPAFSNIIEPKQESVEGSQLDTKIERLPAFSNIIEPKKESVEDKQPDTKTERLPAFSNIIEPKTESVESNQSGAVSLIDKEPPKLQEPKMESLPDPINFFSSNVDNKGDANAYNNFSRLSSYFTSPPKPDHSKSFFELSQSQDHYRHKPEQKTYDSIQSNVKSFFETANTSVNNTNILKSANIPQNYIDNMNLVCDLASYKNFSPKDDVVRTVNYFTVEYNFDNGNDINIGEPKGFLTEKPGSIETNDNKEHKNSPIGDIEQINLKLEDVINACKYCCDPTKNFTRIYLKNLDFDNFKVKKNMDTSSESKKEGDNNSVDRKDAVNKKGMTVNFCDQTFHDETNDRISLMAENRNSSEYGPVKHHWFYRVELEEKSIWRGFSAADSRALENAFNSSELNEDTIVATDGGRFDVNVMGRLRTAVYWPDKPSNVMRCSWFYKGTTDPRYVPYTESIAEKLEEEYRHGVTTGEWHRRLMLPNNEMVIMHGPSVMVHFLQSSTTDSFTASPQSMMRPRVVRRGCVESEIEDTEPSSIDHLLLMCHGVGSACDMRFRSVEEVVDDFRATSLQLIQSHYKNSYDSGLVGRVEVLPISWHSSLHSGETGVDTRLAAVTLESIPRLRNFTNDTLLDVLFYTSPVFCQTIIDTVCKELNRIYALFKLRNPDYRGGVSLGGHSLGSVILYDLLCHQPKNGLGRVVSTEKQYVTGTAGTGQPSVKYPCLHFNPDALYALGSPIAIFECIRGVQTLGQEFCLPTCKNFFNIFHPYDPIAYRIEPMINPVLRDVKPFLIPHHKGRKRMHLELKDTMARVGADIKQKLIESIKNTWSSMWKTQPPPDTHLQRVVEEEMEKDELNAEPKEDQTQITPEMLGNLNGGRRIDHVLQEAPFEMINEYLFAMSSHVCYWESEDTMLVMLREIYAALGVTADCSLPQTTMTVQRRRPDDTGAVSSPESPSTSRGSS